jgi:hypothetical protein
MKKLIIISFILVFTLPVFAKQPKSLMHSNKRGVTMYINGSKGNWVIAPELNPDVLNLYSTTEKTQRIKFVSDIDSLEFIVKVNKPVDFAIIWKNDTANCLINFTNKFENTISNEEKLYNLSYFWSEVKYNFAFIDELKFDWDSLYRSFIPKVLGTNNDFEFYKQMELFASSLKDLHTQIYYRKGNQYKKYIPLLAKYFNNDLFIISSYNNEFLPPVGSKILKINNMQVDEYMLKEIMPFVNSNFSPTVKNISASRLFASDLETNKLTLTYKTPDGNVFSKIMPRNNGENMGNSTGYAPQYAKRAIEIDWQKNDIALLKFNTFNSDETLIPMFEKMKDTLYFAKGIIIDLRQNSGGSTSMAWYLLQHIIKDKYFLNYAYQTRINNGVKRATGNFIEENAPFLGNTAFQTFMPDTIYIPDSIKQFNCPIVILTSNNTCSAAEDFLIILKERHDRPLFIGQATMGSTGSPLVLWNFPENAMARLCARRVLYPYSLKPYTEGVYPDIQVDYTLDEFLNQEIDKEVDVAVKELEKQMN